MRRLIEWMRENALLPMIVGLGCLFAVVMVWAVNGPDRETVIRRDAIEIVLSDGTRCVVLYGKLACGCAGGAKP